jgi:hypothetical protein
MSTTYLGQAARDQMAQAQAELDQHLAVSLAGRCRTCWEAEPCSARRAASAVFARYHCLPRRRPGLASKGFQ